MVNLIRKTHTKPYQNRPRFVKDMTKIFWCVFRFIVLTAVHLQNANAKFHKVEYSGEAENVYCTRNLLWTICSKLYHNRSRFVHCISKKHFGVFPVQSVGL